jgi:proline dehydrogenase
MERQVPLELEAAKKLGYNIGIKLIRGAYMNEERRLAKEQGYESPVQDTIEDTHRNYNTNMGLIFQTMRANDRVFLGSHNQESCELAKKYVVQYGLNKNQVNFGQLKAFSDQITGVLATEGFTVFKYLPYGPTETVMPYLVRRGQESKQVLREQRFQNEFLKAEIKRRLMLGKNK